jgi:peptidyl-prolyl cis-trans isomerase C
MTKLFALIGAAFLIFISCGSKQKTEGASQAPAGGTVLAKVNGKVLTYEDLQQQFSADERGQLRGKDLQNAIDTWVSTELLAQQGEKLGLDKGPEMDAIMRFRRNDAIAGRVLDHEMALKANVSQREIDSAYYAQKENYKLNEDRLRASHIIVRSQEEAQAIYNRLKKGDDFANLAQEYSIDKQTAANGGDLGYFSADQASQFDPAFSKAVLKLKVGEYSQPVETKYGFHIIKLTDVMKEGTSLDSMTVKNEISDGLKKAKQGQAFNSLIDSLKAAGSVEKFTPPGLDLEVASDSGGR